VDNNLSDLLRKEIPSNQLDLIHRTAAEASTLGFPVYIVGGFVRDLLLGHPSLDFDLVVEGDAPKLAHALASKYGGKVTAHTKFGTAKWDIRELGIGNRKLEIESLDLISARSETYRRPAALPTVKMGIIGDDLRRRDFTINTLAIRLDGDHFGELRDEHGGLKDLQKGLVRILHARSFIDDPTRMFRAVRYEKRYGIKIAKETLALIPAARQYISSLSAQRIRHELDLILDESHAASMLARLDELDLLRPIHPALHFDRAAQARLALAKTIQPSIPNIYLSSIESSNTDYRDFYWLLWLMTLSDKEIKSLNKQLHFTAPLLKSLLASSKLLTDLSVFIKLKPSQCAARLEKLPLISIYAVSLAARRGKPTQNLEKYLAEWRHVKPKTNGHDLRNLGLEPGPKYRIILRKLKNAWLDGEVENVEEEKRLLKKILN
jgi:tRNA nucleotidyltransferase (CCA-adding enzyme)